MPVAGPSGFVVDSGNGYTDSSVLRCDSAGPSNWLDLTDPSLGSTPLDLGDTAPDTLAEGGDIFTMTLEEFEAFLRD